jgi:hypothetical protein
MTQSVHVKHDLAADTPVQQGTDRRSGLAPRAIRLDLAIQPPPGSQRAQARQVADRAVVGGELAGKVQRVDPRAVGTVERSARKLTALPPGGVAYQADRAPRHDSAMTRGPGLAPGQAMARDQEHQSAQRAARHKPSSRRARPDPNSTGVAASRTIENKEDGCLRRQLRDHGALAPAASASPWLAGSVTEREDMPPAWQVRRSQPRHRPHEVSPFG